MKNKTTLGLLALGAGMVGSLTALPAQAFSFGTTGVSFVGELELTFDSSVGSYISDLYLYKVDNGTIDTSSKITVFGESIGGTGTSKTVTLSSGTWTFALDTVNPASVPDLYSTSALNPGGTQQAVFGQNLNFGEGVSFASLNGGSLLPYQAATLAQLTSTTGVTVAFDDTGANNDSDFNDFVFNVTGTLDSGSAPQPVPEPTTIAGMLLAGAGLLYGRKKMKAVSDS